jgi:hypothetical protein
VFRFLRWKAKSLFGLASVSSAHPGAVSVIQRSSSHLALNIHFHSLFTDGVFVQEAPGDPVSFRELPAPTSDEVTEVAQEVCHRTVALLKKKGVWFDEESAAEDPLASNQPALAAAYQVSVRGVLSMGPRRGQRVVRLFGTAATEGAFSDKRPSGGFDLHAKRATHAGDRDGVERLARYILRPPLAQNHLERLTDGRVVLRLKRAWRDGTTAVVFEPEDFLSKLTALIPRPRVNTIRFHGVYAARARFREKVVPEPDELPEGRKCPCARDTRTERKYRLAWAELLKRTFSVDVLLCPRCESRMTHVAWILEKSAIRKILTAVGLPADSPAFSPASTEEETVDANPVLW